MESSLRRRSVKEKLELLRKDQSATIIQSVWRGRKVRIANNVTPKSKTVQFFDKDLKEDPVEDEDDEVIPANDNEEVKRDEYASTVEQTSIIEIVSGKSDNIAAVSERSVRWNEPIVENWSIWPSVFNDDKLTEDMIYVNKKLYIRAVTWNLCAKKPPPVEETRRSLLPPNRFHMYFIGTEECERSIAQSAVNTSKKNWEGYLADVLGSNYEPIRAQTLQAIHLIMFAHKSISYLCSDVTSAVVPTGIGNTLGNKGAVAIQFNVGKTKIVVVNSHLAAHQNAVKQRNADFDRINREMPSALCMKRRYTARKVTIGNLNHKESIGPGNGNTFEWTPLRASFQSNARNSIISTTSDSGTKYDNPRQSGSYAWNNGTLTRESSSSQEAVKRHLLDPLQPASLTNYGDRVIFMGDMNYRIRGNRSVVTKLLDLRMHEVMLNNDQLRWSMKERLAFDGFTEPPLNFKPTYKLDIDSDAYDTGPKKRIPAWTDRILYINRGITCLAYNSDFNLRTSDHRPVYASFVVDVDLDEVDILRSLDEMPASHPIRESIPEDFNEEMSMNPKGNNQMMQQKVAIAKVRSQEFKSESEVCSLM